MITLDGPAATGKGTLGRLLALRLGYHYLDSGALYRLVALQSKPESTAAQLTQIALSLNVRFQVQPDDADQLIAWLDERDVTLAIRTESIGRLASEIAILPELRSALMQRQHDFRQLPGLIADGRDMGTVVFPDAPLKFFLTADFETRVERRYKQLKYQNACTTIAAVSEQVAARDAQDRNRQVAPLRPADDAVTLDSTRCDIKQMLTLLEERAVVAFGIS